MIAYLKAHLKDDITEILDVYESNEYFNDVTEVYRNRGVGGT